MIVESATAQIHAVLELLTELADAGALRDDSRRLLDTAMYGSDSRWSAWSRNSANQATLMPGHPSRVLRSGQYGLSKRLDPVPDLRPHDRLHIIQSASQQDVSAPVCEARLRACA